MRKHIVGFLVMQWFVHLSSNHLRTCKDRKSWALTNLDCLIFYDKLTSEVCILLSKTPYCLHHMACPLLLVIAFSSCETALAVGEASFVMFHRPLAKNKAPTYMGFYREGPENAPTYIGFYREGPEKAPSSTEKAPRRPQHWFLQGRLRSPRLGFTKVMKENCV